MKTFRPFFAVIITIALCQVSASSQITVGTSTLPDIGDVLEYALFTQTGDTTSYREDGGNLSWSFNAIIVDSTEQEAYLDITGSPLQDSFPTANMIVGELGSEAAALRTSNKIEILGFGGGPLALFGGGNIVFQDPFVYRQVPIDFGDSFQDEVGFSILIDASIIPGLDSIMLPIPGTTIDSIRFGTTINQTQEATAWGDISVGGSVFDVLKVTQTDVVSTSIELGIGLNGSIILWIDASAFLGGFAGGGDEETVTYKFLSADSKESILEVIEERVPIDTMGNTELIVTGRVKASLITSNKDHFEEIADLEVFPNPASNELNLTTELSGEIEEVRISNAYGQLLRRYEGSDLGKIDVSSLSSGNYILEVFTQKAKGVEVILIQR